MTDDFRSRLENFLDRQSNIEQLTPDASTREYFRVKWRGETAIACVYPTDEPGKAQFAACLDVTKVFLAENLPVAQIFASDAEQLIIIHEDFGDTILRNVLLNSDETERERLTDKAIELIARIQAATAKAFELDSISAKLKFDKEKLFWELNFFKQHYFTSLKKQTFSAAEDAALDAEFQTLAEELEKRAEVLCHRDFHAANLMIQDGELKIIDHQDARIGTTSYDLVSFLLDRVTTAPTPEYLREKRSLFNKEREKLGLKTLDEQELTDEFRLQTIQRCLKAIGTFSFQSALRGRTQYLRFIEPMFEIVLRACEKAERFPTLQKIVRRQI